MTELQPLLIELAVEPVQIELAIAPLPIELATNPILIELAIAPSTVPSLAIDFGLPGPAGPAGGVTTNTNASVDGEAAIFYGTDGKILKRATHTGLIKATSGVIATATPDTDYLSPTSNIDGGTFT